MAENEDQIKDTVQLDSTEKTIKKKLSHKRVVLFFVSALIVGAAYFVAIRLGLFTGHSPASEPCLACGMG